MVGWFGAAGVIRGLGARAGFHGIWDRFGRRKPDCLSEAVHFFSETRSAESLRDDLMKWGGLARFVLWQFGVVDARRGAL